MDASTIVLLGGIFWFLLGTARLSGARYYHRESLRMYREATEAEKRAARKYKKVSAVLTEIQSDYDPYDPR